MAEVLLFHHAQGLTPGVQALAATLREAGHTVHTPDLFAGKTFDTIEEGLAFVQATGFGEIVERGKAAAASLSPSVVYAGLSLGVLPAQILAQTKPGAMGALLIASCLPAADFGGWPQDLPVHVHAMEADPVFTKEGDIQAAEALVASSQDAELFLYPGEGHLFIDSSLAEYDEDATRLLVRRVLRFLAALE